jgi:hypothetical protein
LARIALETGQAFSASWARRPNPSSEGPATDPPHVDVHGGDPQPLLVERRHGLDDQPFYERTLAGKVALERGRVARGVRRQQLLGAGLAVGTLHARERPG